LFSGIHFFCNKQLAFNKTSNTFERYVQYICIFIKKFINLLSQKVNVVTINIYRPARRGKKRGRYRKARWV